MAHTLQKAGKAEADVRVERSLYRRAVGYSYDAVKIFCDKNGKVTRRAVPRARSPRFHGAYLLAQEPRSSSLARRLADAWQMEDVLGRYITSDRPMDRGGGRGFVPICAAFQGSNQRY